MNSEGIMTNQCCQILFTCHIYPSFKHKGRYLVIKVQMSITVIVIFATATAVHAKASWLRPGPYVAAMGREPAMGPKNSHKGETSQGDNFPQNQKLKKTPQLHTDYEILFQVVWFQTDFVLILHSSMCL